MLSALQGKVIHIVGIGGIGMSAIALVLKRLGHTVQGSNEEDNNNVRTLVEEGVHVFLEHTEHNIENADIVAHSSAIKQNNPELVFARSKQKNIVSRAELLSLLMRSKQSIAITGTHGKTTTTGMIGSVLKHAGIDPTVLNGGIMLNNSSNVVYGNGNWLAAEVDESDGTMAKVAPFVGVVTNIDDDHLELYDKSFIKLRESFYKFLHNIDCVGFAVICFEDVELRRVVNSIQPCRFFSYGISCDEEVDLRAVNIAYKHSVTEFDVVFSEKISARVGYDSIKHCSILVPGEHNALNALAAIGVAIGLGIEAELIKEGLRQFLGIERRFNLLGSALGARFVSDYAHHPTEIVATIRAAREVLQGQGRVIAVLQPHRYSRVEILFDKFVEVLRRWPDFTILLDVYNVNNEPKIPGCDSIDLVNRLKSNNCHSACYVSVEALSAELKQRVRDGDIVLFMGAGDINGIAKDIFKELACVGSL